MDLSKLTAERVKAHQPKLREAYQLYSQVADGLHSAQFTHNRYDDDTELWFLSTTLVGIPSQVCGIFIVCNYQDRPIQFSVKGIHPKQHREFNRFRSALYAAHIRNDRSSPYREQLREAFDLRRTGKVGIAVVDLIDEELLELFEFDDLKKCSQEVCTTHFDQRNLVFRVIDSDSLITPNTIDTGDWNECAVIGPREATSRGMFRELIRGLYNPRDDAVHAGHKRELRQRTIEYL